MILHLPMLNIIVPGNVAMFMSLIFPIAMFDVLENDYANPSMLFDFEPEEKSDDIFGQIRDLGYETHSSILNLGTLFVLVCWWTFKVILCGIIGLFSFVFGPGR